MVSGRRIQIIKRSGSSLRRGRHKPLCSEGWREVVSCDGVIVLPYACSTGPVSYRSVKLSYLERSGNKRARLVIGPVEHAYGSTMTPSHDTTSRQPSLQRGLCLSRRKELSERLIICNSLPGRWRYRFGAVIFH